MFERIVNFLTKNKTTSVFNKKYRNGYKNVWIYNLRDYSP